MQVTETRNDGLKRAYTVVMTAGDIKERLDERLVELLGGVLDREGVLVALGGELPAPGLNRCALVAASYGAGTGAEGESGALGTLGVIGPSRMDYARVIPLVGYCSRLVTEQLDA